MCLTVTIHTLHILFLGQLTILDIDSTQIWHIRYLIFLQQYLSSKLLLVQKCEFFANLFIRITHAILWYRKYSTNIQSNTKFGPVVLITWFHDCISMGCHHKTWWRINGKWRVLTFLCFLLWRIRLAPQHHSAQQPTVTVNIKCCVRKNLNIVTLYISDIVTIWYFIAMVFLSRPRVAIAETWDTSRPGSGHVSCPMAPCHPPPVSWPGPEAYLMPHYLMTGECIKCIAKLHISKCKKGRAKSNQAKKRAGITNEVNIGLVPHE